MHDRTVLGPADVDGATLTAMVAGSLGARDADVMLLDSRVEEFPYDLPAITTGGRYVVSGTADVDGHRASYALFVKVVQSWSRSPLFRFVPEEIRDFAESSVPWRTEPLAYRSDLASCLPDGLTMPRALGVFDLDEKSASIWLQMLCVVDRPWDDARYARAAYLLGRLAASPRVAPLAGVGECEFTMRDYAFGRLSNQVLPMVRDDGIWQHPLVATTFGEDLRRRMQAAADRVPELVGELMTLPHTSGHGDACPNNLLATPDSDDFTLIDYGFWMPMPVGSDLAQLLVGDVQIGKRHADDLAARDELIVTSYVEGLRAEGCDIPESVVRRSHAVHLLLMSGLSSLPDALLESDPTDPEVVRLSTDRAAIARFALDSVEATSGGFKARR
ncbi:MAG: phosphotransferase [Nocardioides sp.]